MRKRGARPKRGWIFGGDAVGMAYGIGALALLIFVLFLGVRAAHRLFAPAVSDAHQDLCQAVHTTEGQLAVLQLDLDPASRVKAVHAVTSSVKDVRKLGSGSPWTEETRAASSAWKEYMPRAADAPASLDDSMYTAALRPLDDLNATCRRLETDTHLQNRERRQRRDHPQLICPSVNDAMLGLDEAINADASYDQRAYEELADLDRVVTAADRERRQFAENARRARWRWFAGIAEVDIHRDTAVVRNEPRGRVVEAVPDVEAALKPLVDDCRSRGHEVFTGPVPLPAHG
jgi:hypothetical protein